MPLSLLALALAAFGIGTTEFVIMGLLPEVAGDLGVSIPRAGLLITGYALGVALGGPFLALGTSRLPRKATLTGLMVVFVLGNLGCALAPTYSILMAARVGTALCHAAFFGIGAVVAASLVAPNKRAQAMALMFSGLTVANILGVPLGTWLGQAYGWRATFWAVALFGVGATFALVRWVPHQAAGERRHWHEEFHALGSLQIWLALGTSVLASTSMFILFTYIAPVLRDVTGIAPSHVGGVLLLCGIGITAGNLIGARLADWRLLPSLIGIFAVLAVALGAFALAIGIPWAAIAILCLWGAASFAACTALQARVVTAAKKGANMASTLNIAAFNLGNALGAWLGGLVLTLGGTLRELPWAATVPALVALAVTAFALFRERGIQARASAA